MVITFLIVCLINYFDYVWPILFVWHSALMLVERYRNLFVDVYLPGVYIQYCF